MLKTLMRNVQTIIAVSINIETYAYRNVDFKRHD